MTSLGNVVNPRAPVRCYSRGERVGELSEERREFPNLQSFLAFYVPRHHGVASVISTFLYTDVLLERLDDAPPGGSDYSRAEPRQV